MITPNEFLDNDEQKRQFQLTQTPERVQFLNDMIAGRPQYITRFVYDQDNKQLFEKEDSGREKTDENGRKIPVIVQVPISGRGCSYNHVELNLQIKRLRSEYQHLLVLRNVDQHYHIGIKIKDIEEQFKGNLDKDQRKQLSKDFDYLQQQIQERLVDPNERVKRKALLDRIDAVEKEVKMLTDTDLGLLGKLNKINPYTDFSIGPILNNNRQMGFKSRSEYLLDRAKEEIEEEDDDEEDNKEEERLKKQQNKEANQLWTQSFATIGETSSSWRNSQKEDSYQRTKKRNKRKITTMDGTPMTYRDYKLTTKPAIRK